MTASVNFTMATVKTLPSIETTSSITTTKVKSFLGKLFGLKGSQTNLNNPGRFKRNNDNTISGVTEPYKYMKSTLPIIMDTTTSTNDGKKHLGYADIQSKTTKTTISPKLTKKRRNMRKFLMKVLHKKQKGKQKRDALMKLHREIRFSPFKKLKKIFQASSSKKPLTKFEDVSYVTDFTKTLIKEDKQIPKMQKQLPNTFENKFYKKDKVMPKFSIQNKNIFPTEDFGGFKLEENPPLNKWKSQKDDLGFNHILDEFTKYPILKHDPNYLKAEKYFETIKSKNEKLFYNKYRNKIHPQASANKISSDYALDLKFDSSELSPTITFYPFTQFIYDQIISSNARLDPNAKFDPNTGEANANFDLNTKDSKFEKYAQTNSYDANNKDRNDDINKPRKLESMGSGYSIISNPMWQMKESNDLDNKLDESRVNSKADTGKPNITLSLG